jgi:Kef-type K+ transport system membrane component KefB
MAQDQAITLLFIAVSVALLPGVARLLRLPAPVAEILFGVVIGKSVLDLHLGGEWLPFLAELGFLMLMFQAGMEINFAMLRRQSRGQLGFQGLIFLATLAMAFIFAFMLGRGAFMALVLSTTSLGLVMPVLKETGRVRTDFGQSILIAATLADFLTLLGITVFLLLRNHGLSFHLVYPLPLFAAFGLFLWAGRLWAWWHPDTAERIIVGKDAQERGIRSSLALLFLFVGLSELVHIEPVLGAFMGGAIISFIFREKQALETKLSAMGFGFLIPIFFITVGMRFDATNLLQGGALAFTLVLFLAALATKIVPAMLFVFQGRKPKEALRAGFLLSSRLSLIIAAAAVGVQEGLIDQQTKDAVVLLALLSCLAGPSLFRIGLPALEEGPGRRRG